MERKDFRKSDKRERKSRGHPSLKPIFNGALIRDRNAGTLLNELVCTLIVNVRDCGPAFRWAAA